MAAIVGFFRSKVMQHWPKGLHRPLKGIHIHCLQCAQCIGRHCVCVWGAPYDRTRGHLCHAFKMCKQGSHWAGAVLASGLLVPKQSQLIVSSLTHKEGKGREISLKQNALRNGQERPGISVVAICSAITTHLDLGTM